MRAIDMVVLHQTGTASGTLESVRRYHMQKLGWSDIGYHYLITRDGKVHKGRANSEVGAHCKGDNATSIGVCCVGAGDALPIGSGYMTQAIWDSLFALVQRLVGAYNVPVHCVVGHRERPSGIEQGKTCPGFDAAIMRNLLRKEV
jgi:N-acetylmuramoyl-L-alanine amidase